MASFPFRFSHSFPSTSIKHGENGFFWICIPWWSCYESIQYIKHERVFEASRPRVIWQYCRLVFYVYIYIYVYMNFIELYMNLMYILWTLLNTNFCLFCSKDLSTIIIIINSWRPVSFIRFWRSKLFSG